MRGGDSNRKRLGGSRDSVYESEYDRYGIENMFFKEGPQLFNRAAINPISYKIQNENCFLLKSTLKALHNNAKQMIQLHGILIDKPRLRPFTFRSLKVSFPVFQDNLR